MNQRIFPAIVPSSRKFVPGERPETQFRAQNGATTFVSFGNRPVDCQLELIFNNIDDSIAAEILDHYRSVLTSDYVMFDNDHGLGGMLPVLQSSVDSGTGDLKYRYSKPPEVTSVFPGVSSVVCSFTGYLFGG
tara:strand:+ start:624 stop:1022 length:399 start_codon:yes stop_codon:yes gene_type:complete